MVISLLYSSEAAKVRIFFLIMAVLQKKTSFFLPEEKGIAKFAAATQLSGCRKPLLRIT